MKNLFRVFAVLSFFLYLTPAHPAPVLVNHLTFGCASSCTSGPLNTVGSTIIFACIADKAGDGGFIISDSKGNTWTQGVPLNYNDGLGDSHVKFMYTVAPTNDAAMTFAVGGGTNFFMGVTIGAFKGTTGFQDQIAGTGNSASTTIQPGSITASLANSIYVSCLSMGYIGTASINSSFSIVDQIPLAAGSNYGSAMATKVSSGAENPTWTITGAGAALAAEIITFAPAPPSVVGPFFHSFPP